MKHFIYILLVISIVSIILLSNPIYEESFVPKMLRESYRPLERNVRRNAAEVYEKSSITLSNMFRRIGIM